MDETSTDEHHLIQNMSELTQLLGPEMSGTLSALLQRMASGSSTNPAAPAIQQSELCPSFPTNRVMFAQIQSSGRLFAV